MIILVGDGPDFAMRQGAVEIFHKGVVRAVDSGGVEKFHESTSDRSLWVVARVVTGYLRSNGVGMADINRMVFVGLRADLRSSDRTIQVSMTLPGEIAFELQSELAQHLLEFIKQFLNNVNFFKPGL